MLPTPENTPGPQDPDTQSEHTIEPHPDPEPQNNEGSIATSIATREIISDFSEGNIIEGPRQQKPSDRRAAYFAELERPQELPAYLAAFSSGLLYSRNQQDRLHRDQLPPPPRSWKDMLAHPYKDGFLAAANKEYSDLEH
jgi:hypothetical protein